MPVNPLTYYVNQIPAEGLLMTVKDERRIARSLSTYNSVELKIVGPDGLSRTGGTAVITNAAAGTVTYTFPTNVSLFDVVGDYECQLLLRRSAGTFDPANKFTLTVEKGVGF